MVRTVNESLHLIPYGVLIQAYRVAGFVEVEVTLVLLGRTLAITHGEGQAEVAVHFAQVGYGELNQICRFAGFGCGGFYLYICVLAVVVNQTLTQGGSDFSLVAFTEHFFDDHRHGSLGHGYDTVQIFANVNAL